MSTIRKAWHSGLRRLVFRLVVLVGVGAIIVAGVSALDSRWAESVAYFVTGATVIGTSLGLANLAFNEPEVTLCVSQTDINDFLSRFIARGSSAHIASFSLSWVQGDPTTEEFLIEQSKAGKSLTIFVEKATDLTHRLSEAGIRITQYPDGTTDVPHFTYLNLGRDGARLLAVARGTLPNHWIDVYNDHNHQQVMAIARAYLRNLEKL